jgi:hypothetical protein
MHVNGTSLLFNFGGRFTFSLLAKIKDTRLNKYLRLAFFIFFEE